jgi:hypothetical protein
MRYFVAFVMMFLAANFFLLLLRDHRVRRDTQERLEAFHHTTDEKQKRFAEESELCNRLYRSQGTFLEATIRFGLLWNEGLQDQSHSDISIHEAYQTVLGADKKLREVETEKAALIPTGEWGQGFPRLRELQGQRTAQVQAAREEMRRHFGSKDWPN